MTSGTRRCPARQPPLEPPLLLPPLLPPQPPRRLQLLLLGVVRRQRLPCSACVTFWSDWVLLLLALWRQFLLSFSSTRGQAVLLTRLLQGPTLTGQLQQRQQCWGLLRASLRV
jgi:hypothetical protein